MPSVETIRNICLSALCMISFGMMSGCAHDFVRPAPDAVRLGKSHPDEVIRSVAGTPVRQNNVSINNEKINLLTYHYVGNVPFWGYVIPQHTLTYSFFNDVLVGEELNSTYEGENTEFDIKKVSQIQKGLTKDKVIEILGKPSGQLLYPLITDKTGSGLAYAYSYARFAGVFTPSWSYLLIVTFNESNVVTNISYKENGKEMIAQSNTR